MADRNRDRKFIGYFEDAVARLREMGLGVTLIEALRAYGLLATDNVTGFHEGRSGGGLIAGEDPPAALLLIAIFHAQLLGSLRAEVRE